MQYIYSQEKKVAVGKLANPGVLGRKIILLSIISFLHFQNEK